MERLRGKAWVPVPKKCRCHVTAAAADLSNWNKVRKLKKFGLKWLCPKPFAQCQKNQDWNIKFLQYHAFLLVFIT